MIHFILGGARSGKSRFAETRVLASGKKAVYIATSPVVDDETAQRIAHHQARRDERWQTVEETTAVADALQKLDNPNSAILVDCLTLWLGNCLFADDKTLWQVQRQALLATLPILKAEVFLVSNEIGSGVIPMGVETRKFVDELGFLHQEIAQLADRASLLVAGLEQRLKG